MRRPALAFGSAEASRPHPVGHVLHPLVPPPFRYRWTVSNLCRGKPPPRWGLVADLLQPLITLIHHTDEEVLVDACWALSYLCEPSERINFLIGTGALPRLTALLGHSSPSVQTPALRCIGNVATGTAEQTQAVLACDALSAFGRLIDSGKKELKKEACWIVSNVAAGSALQIDGVCASGLIPPLIRLVCEEEFDIRKEAAYALCNACSGASQQTLSGLVYHGVVGSLCPLLSAPDVELIFAVLEALGAALEGGEAGANGGDNRVVQLVEEAGGCEQLEALQMHENPDVYAKVRPPRRIDAPPRARRPPPRAVGRGRFVSLTRARVPCASSHSPPPRVSTHRRRICSTPTLGRPTRRTR